MKKKLLSILVVLAMVIAMLPAMTMTSLAEVTKPDDATWLVDEGDNHVWWKLDSGTLTIGGIGDMLDFPGYPNYPPWHDNKDTITTGIIESGVTSIGKYAFYECENLTSVTIPSSVTSIGAHAFQYCKKLESITIPSLVTSIGEHAFGRCEALKNITIPSSVTSIEASTFTYCGALTSVEIPSSVTSIGNSAFNNCSALESVTIPSSVTSIGNSAFGNCSGLESITIPSSVTTIGNNVFSVCSGLTKVIVKATKPPTLGRDAFYRAFVNCKIYVPNGSDEFYRQKENWSSYSEKIAEAYMVNVDYTTNGTVTVDKDCFPVETYTEETKTVTVSVTPDTGYELKNLSYYTTNPESKTDITATKSFTMPKANVTVEAAFQEQTATLTYDANGHGIAPEAVTMKYFEETKAASALKAEGYTFVEWNTQADGKGTSYEAGAKVKAKDVEPSKTTLFAIWKLAKPEITKGDNQKVKAGAKEGVTVTSNAPFDTFEKVLVDGKEITKDEDYTVKEGSTIVTLKPEYVATLKAGEHKVEIVSEGGTATAKLTITDTPETADANNMLIWIILALAAISLTTCTVLRVKRTNK